MSQNDVIRSWKDAKFRNSLSANELANLPENPAGAVELNTEDLVMVNGGATLAMYSYGCCPTEPTQYQTCIGLTKCGLICPTSPWLCG
jgi:mersacidin/lichenicidin family type 2 lantibiotic